MTDPASSALLGPLFSSGEMRALFADKAVIGRMLQFENALARAEVAAGVIPSKAASAIDAACKPSLYDAAAIGKAAGLAGNVAIPFVKALTAQVAHKDADASRFVHWGGTSQDVIDTANSLAFRAGAKLLARDLQRTVRGLVRLSEKHRKTPVIARTLMQHALPTTFGLKLANEAAAFARAAQLLDTAVEKACVLQFAGAAGTLAALGRKGPAVAKRLASELKLPPAGGPWHAQRDRIAELASALGIVIGTCGKFARDISLHMQTEVGEVFEPAAKGRGGSSAMPHKRNPALSFQILASANLAPGLVASVLSGMVQEHERATGGWQSEWIAMPQLFLLASGALERTAEIAEGMEVHRERMRKNLDLTNGLIMAESAQLALRASLGKNEAHELLEDASRKALRSNRHLMEILVTDPRVSKVLTRKLLQALFDPLSYLGSANEFQDQALRSARRYLQGK
jgi:3-carboxy-cis,cis-muconate cycloisomerase